MLLPNKWFKPTAPPSAGPRLNLGVSCMKSIPPFSADIAHAREVAKLVLAGVMTPRHGCARIAEVSTAIGSPRELVLFELLNHEQYGH